MSYIQPSSFSGLQFQEPPAVAPVVEEVVIQVDIPPVIVEEATTPLLKESPLPPVTPTLPVEDACSITPIPTLYEKAVEKITPYFEKLEAIIKRAFESIDAFFTKHAPSLVEKVKEISSAVTSRITFFVKSYPLITGIAVTIIVVVYVVWSQKKKRDLHRLRIQHSKLATENTRLPKENKDRVLETTNLKLESKKLRVIQSYNDMLVTLINSGKNEEQARRFVDEQIELALRTLDNGTNVSAKAIEQQTQQIRANSPKKREGVRGGCDEWH